MALFFTTVCACGGVFFTPGAEGGIPVSTGDEGNSWPLLLLLLTLAPPLESAGAGGLSTLFIFIFIFILEGNAFGGNIPGDGDMTVGYVTLGVLLGSTTHPPSEL